MATDNSKAPENQNEETKSDTEKKPPKPPEISPYVFPALLAGFGLWCFYDGWLTTNVEMLEHQLFNRVVAGILLPWAVYDFLKVRKYERKHKKDGAPAESEVSTEKGIPAKDKDHS